jgi:glycopeptide antibiotics resistance protein
VNAGQLATALTASTVALAGVVWFALAWHLHRRGRNVAYVALFTVFFVYGFKVLDYTLFQYQSLLLLQHFDPNLILNGVPDDERLNLVPVMTLGSADIRTSLLNVAMMVPFGLGLPFLTGLRWGSVVTAGALVSVAIELLQLVTGLLGGITFRVADVNDVIFNATGAGLGYLLFGGIAAPGRPLHPMRRRVLAGRSPGPS